MTIPFSFVVVIDINWNMVEKAAGKPPSATYVNVAGLSGLIQEHPDHTFEPIGPITVSVLWQSGDSDILAGILYRIVGPKQGRYQRSPRSTTTPIHKAG